jgi:DegV family protein with EDD domain
VPVRIVTDSACDLPDAVIRELGIEVVPLTIRFGDDEFVDRRDLTPAQFWARCAESPVLPETAAPAPGQFEEAYRRLAADGATGIVVVNIASGLSATMQSAQLAANAVAESIPVRIVDSETATLGQGMIAVAAARVAATGADLDAVEAAALDATRRTQVFGTLDTLENLKKGGRIGNARALLASVLSIKPIIEIRDGRVEEGGKQRTRSKALAFLVAKLSQAGQIENLAVLQAECPDVEEFVAQVRTVYPGEIVIGDIGPVVGTHAGRGTIGIAYQLATPRS